MDFSESILAEARTNIEQRHLAEKITLRQGNLRELPFAEGEFHYVLCWGVLMHVPDIEAAISELARVVAPGGKLIVSEDNMNSVQPVTHRALLRLIGRPARSSAPLPASRSGARRTPAC